MASNELKKTAGYPQEKRMSARYEGTFAYLTLKDRMPRILTQIVDTVNREEKRVADSHGEAGSDDMKFVISNLSELRHHLLTNKPMEPVVHGSDIKLWETVFDKYRDKFGGENPKWFSVSWLFAECYMYRKIVEIIRQSKFITDFDPFEEQKKKSFGASMEQIKSVGKFLCKSGDNQDGNVSKMKLEFDHLVLFSLWGNKMDLSMVASMDSYDTSMSTFSSSSSANQAQLMKKNILADHTQILWELLDLLREPKSGSESQRRIDFVVDNAGLELFSDLCFADWLLRVNLADRVVFHFKQMPWFVSDAMIKDFHWTLSLMSNSEDSMLQSLSESWNKRVQEGSFVLTDHPFWTSCYEYTAMPNVADDLYQNLKESHLIFFKGDLNYRKLLADRNWLYTENFSIALGGFEPTNVCALRTLKADLVTGLSPGAANQAASQNKDWMITGQYAVCQVKKKK